MIKPETERTKNIDRERERNERETYLMIKPETERTKNIDRERERNPETKKFNFRTDSKRMREGGSLGRG